MYESWIIIITGYYVLSEWIIGIYLHEFTNNEWKISIPHSAASCGIENFKFIVSERVQVNPDNSRTMNVDIFIIQIEYITNKNRQTLSQGKPWCNDSGVLNLHHSYYTTVMMSRRLFRHNPVSGTNQPIRKSEFVQCMKFG